MHEPYLLCSITIAYAVNIDFVFELRSHDLQSNEKIILFDLICSIKIHSYLFYLHKLIVLSLDISHEPLYQYFLQLALPQHCITGIIMSSN